MADQCPTTAGTKGVEDQRGDAWAFRRLGSFCNFKPPAPALSGRRLALAREERHSTCTLPALSPLSLPSPVLDQYGSDGDANRSVSVHACS